MNNQKFFLIIAILLSLFLLKEQWDRQHAVDTNGNLIYQQQTTSNTPAIVDQELNVPSAINTSTMPDLPSPKETVSGTFVTVNTDLLTLEISHKGGTITNAWLEDYPIELGSEPKFQLLSDKSGELFQAQIHQTLSFHKLLGRHILHHLYRLASSCLTDLKHYEQAVYS